MVDDYWLLGSAIFGLSESGVPGWSEKLSGEEFALGVKDRADTLRDEEV